MPTLELAILFYLFTATAESYAHQEVCEPHLADEATRIIRGEPFEYEGLHIPMVKDTVGKSLSIGDSYSARVMSPQGWTLNEAQDLIFAMLRHAVPGAQPTIARNEPTGGRTISKGDLINFDLKVTGRDTAGFQIEYLVTNGHDMLLLKGQAAVQAGPSVSR
jgi:hypothetical protein